jgi:hypothetical protein
MDWMLSDGDLPRPVAGAVLRSVGLRLRGGVTAAEGPTPDGVVEVLADRAGDQGAPEYALTGVASDGRDVWADYGRRWSGPDRVGAEFVLTVGGELFQVQHGALSSAVPDTSRVTVTGAFELVGEYEWEHFGLVDTRADWFVRQVIELTGGDVLVDLHRS